HRCRPALVALEVGLGEAEPRARFGAALLQHGANRDLALQAAHRGAHLVARRQQLQDAVAADETTSARHQYLAHRRSPRQSVQCAGTVLSLWTESSARAAPPAAPVRVAAKCRRARSARIPPARAPRTR